MTLIIVIVLAAVAFVCYVERASLAKDLKAGISTAVTDLESLASKGETIAKADVVKITSFLKTHI